MYHKWYIVHGIPMASVLKTCKPKALVGHYPENHVMNPLAALSLNNQLYMLQIYRIFLHNIYANLLAFHFSKYFADKS